MGYDSALPATLTTIHVALAVLRRHRARPRGPLSPFVLPSFAFAITPWVWPSAPALLIAITAHVAWMIAAEVLAPRRITRPSGDAPRAPGSRGASPAPPLARRDTPPAFVKAAVLAVIEETPEIRTFRLARPPDFEFVAGQFVPVRLQIDGRPHVRCYSISSPPDVRGYLEISVRRQGVVSSTLHGLLRPGASVAIGRPAGAFTYPANDDRPVALIAGGIGITPLLSMLHCAAAREPSRPITLLYSARSEHDVAFADALRVLAARHPQVHIAITLTQPSGTTSWRTGRIDAAMLRQHVTNPVQTIFCLCGPEPMIQGVSTLLMSIGVPADQIRSEKFETAAAAVNLQTSAEAAAPRAEPAPSRTIGSGRVVSFAASGRRIDCPSSQTLLEAAESAGVAIASSCRAGVCQSCRTRLVEGEADCRSDLLDPDDRAAGFILPCVSWPTADCVLDA